jgi:REP element-mobilizing transposase RayT
MDELVHRKRPVHWLPEPGHPSPIVFLTCCTKNRRSCLDQQRVHDALCEAWQRADQWQVGRYVLMPDHVHLFCAPTESAGQLQRWVGFWRSLVTRVLGEVRGELWQPEFWDTQLRGQDSYAGKWDYVRLNPVRAGLVERPEEWPFQGELNSLEWLGKR